jgi:hypothetical protein
MAEVTFIKVILVALPLLAFLVNLIFGIFMLRRRRILANKMFSLLMFSFCWWNITEFVMRVTDTPTYAQLASRLSFIALSFVPSIAFSFLLALENRMPNRKQAVLVILTPLVFVFLDLRGMLVGRVEYSETFGIFNMVPGNAFPYFAVYISIFLVFVVYHLVRFYNACENQMVKRRMRYFVIGTLITSIIVFITDILPPVFGLSVPPLGSFSTIILTTLTYYSVRGR